MNELAMLGQLKSSGLLDALASLETMLDIQSLTFSRFQEYRVFESIAECYRVLQGVTECYRVLESVTEC